MLLATLAFLGMSACVKLMREGGMSTPGVMFWRMAPGLVWVVPLVSRRTGGFRPAAPGPMALRCAFGISAMATNFYAVRALALVQHNVLHLLQPVFIAMAAPWVLGERLRGLAVVALVLAFVGAVLVLEPGPALLGGVSFWPAVAGVAAAGFSAGAHISVRRVTRDDPPELVVFYFVASVTTVTLVLGLTTAEVFTLPEGMTPLAGIAGVAGMAGLGLLGQLLMTRAYERAPAPMVAMVAYSSIPVSFVIDAVLWQTPATPWTVSGSVLMAVAGVLLVRARHGAQALSPAAQRPASSPSASSSASGTFKVG